MDALDNLLAEALALELRNRRGKGTVCRLEAIKQIARQTYSNPDNWRACNVIELRERTTDSYLGTFQEFLHIRVSARKLVRLSGDDELPATRIEYVEGPEWLGGPFHHSAEPASDAEAEAIRNYFVPHSWQPTWLHKKGKRAAPRTAEQLLNELTME